MVQNRRHALLTLSSASKPRLPEGYTEVKYLYNDGGNRYITFPLTDEANDPLWQQNITIKCKFNLTNTSQTLFGVSTSSNTTQNIGTLRNGKVYWNLTGGLAPQNVTPAITLGKDYTIEINYQKVRLTDEETGTTTEYDFKNPVTWTGEATDIIYGLFAKGGSNQSIGYGYGNGRIYYLQIIHSTIPQYDLVPCINSRNAAGFYDVKNKIFYSYQIKNLGYETLDGTIVPPRT